MFLSYIFLLGLLNFHIFHISSFSTTSCMANQMIESFVHTNKYVYPPWTNTEANIRGFDQ